MINTALKAQIDGQITNETTPEGITPTEVGTNMKSIVDYVDQQVDYKVYKAKLDNPSEITATVLRNDTGKTFTYARNSTGSYNFNFSSLYADLSKIDIYIHLQTGSYAVPQVLIDNLGILATIETKYWNGTDFVLSDGILQNATIYLVVNN